EPKGDIKTELMKLNTVTGDDAQRTRLIQFVKDKEWAKKAVSEGAKMMKAAGAKEKPFNFNACMILAKASHFLKEYDTAELFYEHCVESSTKLGSGGKMLQAYEGLIDMYWDAKKYAAVAELCEKFVELKEPKELDDAKPFVLERLIQAKTKLG